MADTHTYKFNVSMSCSGCSGAVDRVLKKLDGKPPSAQPTQPTPSFPAVPLYCPRRSSNEVLEEPKIS